MDKNYWIEKLKLQTHPDGGFYIENYKSTNLVEYIDHSMEKPHCSSTSIYHLLDSKTQSFCHKLNANEIWYYHYGQHITLYLIDAEGNLSTKVCGPGEDQELAVIIPRNTWFGARIFDPDSYILVSRNVAPGFDWADFEMADRNKMLKKYPQHREIILKEMLA